MPKQFEQKWEVGKPGPSGATIEYIFGSSTQVIVYRDDKNTIQWATSEDELTPSQRLAHQQYDRLATRSRACLPKDKNDRFHDDLAQALFHALSESDEAKALQSFENVAAEVAQEAQRQARARYVESGSWTAAVIAAAAMLMVAVTGYSTVGTVALGAAAGAVGAWASVIQRASRLELGPWDTPAHQAFQGTLRILLGSIFGVFAIAAMKAGLLLSSALNIWGTVLTTAVAGFSERLIPELITRMESREAEATLSVTGGKGPKAIAAPAES